MEQGGDALRKELFLSLGRNHRSHRFVRVLLLAALCWLGASGLAPRAAHAFTHISTCGTTITTPGVYALTTNIGPCAGDGIDIEAHDVLLFCFGGCHVTGSDAAGSVGIRIKSNSANAIVEFFTIKHFDTGIEDDAKNALIDDFDSNLNKTGVLVKHAGGSTVVDFGADDNTVNGVVLNHANNTEVKDFDADTEGGTGIVLDHSNNVELFDFNAAGDVGSGVLLDHSNHALMVDFTTSSSSGDSGVILDHSNNNTLEDWTARSNHKFGVWVKSSSRNVLDDFTANSNLLTGVFLGCSGTGPTGVTCKGPNSTRNVVNDATASFNGNNGVAIDLGDIKNTVTRTFGTGNTGHDGFDENPSCDNNSWTDDVFSVASPSCVH
jgi:parallel beta-helix repeat protein